MSNPFENPPPVPDPVPPATEAGPGEPYQEYESPPELPTIVLAPCWRCGLTVQEGLECPHCGAKPRGSVPISPPAAAERYTDFRRQPPRVLGVIVAYVLLLSTSLIWAAIEHEVKNPTQQFLDTGIVVLEVIDCLFTLFLFLWLGRFHVRKPRVPVRVVAYVVAPFVSIGMYLLAQWYVNLLHSYIKPRWIFVEAHWEFTPFYVILVGVQPAIVEELFFRYFAFGAMRQVTNVHSAVFLSALMFALAHLYNPLGLPFLFLMGVMLGYARASSGGLLLPMLMHFAHNTAVLWFESAL